MRRRSKANDEAEINITPMLDIVFIMLIFFIVTTSFVKEKGLEVSRPSNSPPKEIVKKKGPIVEANLEREKAEKPESPLIIAAHPDADTEALVIILDAAEAVGVGSVSVATTRKQP
jgi:biopolymer transport protein ExbD